MSLERDSRYRSAPLLENSYLRWRSEREGGRENERREGMQEKERDVDELSNSSTLNLVCMCVCVCVGGGVPTFQK